ncbi:hypothetical protein BSM4216_2204 [Bacillus smithii]|nr:hypothetical protein BSM4216_2204 [Bacillus smithii]
MFITAGREFHPAPKEHMKFFSLLISYLIKRRFGHDNV